MEKINSLASADIVANNIQTLKQIFPTIVKEGSIDFNELKALLGETVEDKEEYYRFTWAGKSQARLEANKPTTATLRPCKEESKDWDTTSNIFIEGDNLEVLKLLQKSYANKIKMIYIDPPYNTGKDFVYKDNYADNLGNYLRLTGQTDEEGNKTSTNTESDGRYHSNWLNMMYPRLRLARNLMIDDGVIFISIDDNELSNLKKVCDEVFGEENFQGLISRATGTPTGGGNKAIVNEVDYLFLYSKTGNAEIEGIALSDAEKKIYDREDAKGKYLIRSLRRTGGEDRREDRPSMFYPMTAPDGQEIYPYGPTGYESRWICGLDKYKEMESEGLIEWKKSTKSGEDKWQVFQKFYLEGRLKQQSNLWKNIEGNKKATRDVRNLFNDRKVFDYPKPVELIIQMLKMTTNSSDIILDFFAGSGTTAHAVMQLNAEDGGSRKCISVQLPEPTEEKSEAFKAGYKTIAEITKERIRRAGEKIKLENKGKEGIDKLDIGFKAFRLDSSNIQAWDGNPDNLEDQLDAFANNIKSDRTEEDILFEILLKYGLDLTVPIEEKSIAGKKVFSVGQGTLFICLSDGITSVVSEGIGAWKQELNPVRCTVIFKDTGFQSDKDKTNAMQILKRFGIEEVNSI